MKTSSARARSACSWLSSPEPRRSARAGPIGWGGDRYRVYATPAGPALVWYVVWDDTRSAERFTWGYGGKLRSVSRTGYRTMVESTELGGKPATMYVLAPAAWDGWADVPRVGWAVDKEAEGNRAEGEEAEEKRAEGKRRR